MKKLIIGTVAALTFMAQAALADITMIVPQGPGAGTTVWAEVVAKELEKHLGEKIELRLIPGARDIPGINKWHNELRYDENTIVVTHGGNGVSFLQEEVDYNYSDYESVALMNFSIIAGKIIGADMDHPKFAAGSGMVPEAMAMTLLICGPDKSVDEYVSCFKEHVTWVKGMSGSERRLAFKRGELTGTRENPDAYKKHVAPQTDAEVWFSQGLLDPVTGEQLEDPNYPGMLIEDLFEQRWGVRPSGDFYNAFKLVRAFRDGLQKAIWVDKANPELRARLIEAFKKMVADPESVANIEKRFGKYDWYIGDAGNEMRDTLMTFVTEQALRDLVKFNGEALGLNSVYKPDLVR